MASASLYAHEIGEGVPVVIVHGWEMNGKVEEVDFEPIFEQFPGFRRIYVDLPGMGATPADDVRDLDEMLGRLVGFVGARLGSSRFLVAGSSCGAYLARALAQIYAARVDGLLLRVPLIEPENRLRDIDPFRPLVTDEGALSGISGEDRALFENVLVQTPSYIKALQSKYDKAIVPALNAADNEVLDPIRADPSRYKLCLALDDKEGARVVAPTLIVCGRQDEVVGYRDSLRLLELYPRSTFVVLDRAGHDLPVEQDGVFQALVRDWLSRVIEWRESESTDR
ncbi:hypothetical protein PV08_11889 [Exophiala spinifera]|uniref:AB hydrolase-1 domain-containing protein n=1 Tax=Exophiala spinifera TaxID=91928 RepID=A0A0D2BEG4_9EURO|nr:uncharacterized protein PV08_11889 [Exophiala spinifera]KIW09789.1 hypothetical protein PV08_11889 [Exophiala spinifera]